MRVNKGGTKNRRQTGLNRSKEDAPNASAGEHQEFSAFLSRKDGGSTLIGNRRGAALLEGGDAGA